VYDAAENLNFKTCLIATRPILSIICISYNHFDYRRVS